MNDLNWHEILFEVFSFAWKFLVLCALAALVAWLASDREDGESEDWD